MDTNLSMRMLEITNETELLIKQNEETQQQLEELAIQISIFIQTVLKNPQNKNLSPKVMEAFLMNPMKENIPTKIVHCRLQPTATLGGGIEQQQSSTTVPS